MKLSHLFLCGLLLPSIHASSTRVLYVDGSSPVTSELADGLSPETAFTSIQQAADQARPGDEVVVAAGVYFESVQLRNPGTADAPIVFRADQVEKGRVIITGANKEIRNGNVTWQCVDETLGLYSVQTPSLRQQPSRMLYSGADLFPYPSLDSLKTFNLDPNSYYPGPNHGYAWDADTRTLYVRLHASGSYGSVDPNEHIMAVAPINGAGSGPGTTINRSEHYNFGIMPEGEAHVILQGFTFETPGVAGVYIAGSGEVVVRDCWFTGCRTGVAGRQFYYREQDYGKMTNNVTIEYCDYSCWPAFTDMREIIESPQPPPDPNGRTLDQNLFWWHRKEKLGYDRTYEASMVNAVGDSWTIRYNHIYETIDGLSMWATNCSRNLDVYGNLFERLIDNAVESENHAEDLRVHDNVIVDVFEPFSWQPLSATPWPGPVYIYRNLVYTNEALQGLWKNAGSDSGRDGLFPGVFKIGAKGSSNWNLSRFPHMADVPRDLLRLKGPGLLAWDNIVYCPGHRLFARVGENAKYESMIFASNTVVVDDYNGGDTASYYNGFVFVDNAACFLDPADEGGPEIFTANGGQLVPSSENLGFSREMLEEMSSAALNTKMDILPSVLKAINRDSSMEALAVGPRTSK